VLPRFCSLPNADLGLAIGTPSPNPAIRGQNVAYTFTAANSGPDPADDVYVYSPVPIGTAFVHAATSQGSCSAEAGGPIACSFGSIAAGAAATAKITLLVDPSSTAPLITDKESPNALGARVTGPDHDSNPANNSTSFSTPVVLPNAGDLLTSLIAAVRSFNLFRGVETSLVTKLDGAEQKVAAGRIRPACNELGAFVNEVQDLAARGELTTAQATLLIDQAGLIRSVIPCT
jgi:uncharacterized repeat protein (TIGR01451 family)